MWNTRGVVRRVAGSVAIGVTAAACGHAPSTAPGTSQGPVKLNDVTSAQVVAAIAKAGLPALNSHDVTAQECPSARCSEATATDTVTVLKFPTTGSAQQYAATVSNAFQIEDLVLVFAPSVTAELKRDYEKVVQRAAV